MGPLARFLLALERLARIKGLKIEDAYKFAKQEFGEVTPILKKQIQKVFDKIKKPVVGKPGKKEGTVLPLVRDAKKVEGIETLDDFNLSKDDPMGDFEKIVKGEGDTGLPSQFTNEDIEEAIDNVSPGFVAGDTKYNAELVAEELAVSKGIDYYGLPVKDRAQIYGRAFDGLSKQIKKNPLEKVLDKKFGKGTYKKAVDPDEGIVAADAPKLDSKENIMGAIDKLKNPKRSGGSLDPVTGITRALARRILDKKGIEIGKKDPIDVFTDTFGEAISDVNNLAEEMIEIDSKGGGMKDMDQMLEIEGLFDIEIPENPNKGIPNEEMIEQLEKDLEEKEILEEFDPTFRKPNATGGRVQAASGGLADILKV